MAQVMPLFEADVDTSARIDALKVQYTSPEATGKSTLTAATPLLRLSLPPGEQRTTTTLELLMDSLGGLRITADTTLAAPLLRLPTEMLQQIFEEVEGPDLLTLRLVCRLVGAAAFSLFAHTYLHELKCDLNDPAHVERLIAICSTEQLIAAVKTVTLSMELHWLPVPLSNGCCSSPDLARLAVALGLLACHSCPINLRFEGCEAGPLKLRCEGCTCDHFACNVHDVLNALARAKCQVKAFSMDDQSMPYLPLLVGQTRSALTEAFTSMETFHCKVELDQLAKRQNLDTLSSVARLPKSASKLNSLSLTTGGRGALKRDPRVISFVADILTAYGLQFLAHLHLYEVRVESSVMFAILARCRQTMRRLVLYDVDLASADGGSWEHLLALAYDMPCLSEVHIEECFQNGEWEVCAVDSKNRLGGVYIHAYTKEGVKLEIKFYIDKGLIILEAE